MITKPLIKTNTSHITCTELHDQKPPYLCTIAIAKPQWRLNPCFSYVKESVPSYSSRFWSAALCIVVVAWWLFFLFCWFWSAALWVPLAVAEWRLQLRACGCGVVAVVCRFRGGASLLSLSFVKEFWYLSRVKSRN